jgi:hypothetical protein
MSRINNIKAILVDFDGVIAENSNLISLQFIEDYINGCVPFLRSNIEQFYKSTNSFPVKLRFKMLFTALGIEDKFEDFTEKAGSMGEYKGMQLVVDKTFFELVKWCNENDTICKIFSATSVKRLSSFGFEDQSIIYSTSGLSKADSKTYLHVANDLGIEPDNVMMIDDCPVVLAMAKKAGMITVRKKNNLFNDADFVQYRDFVDFEIEKISEITENINIG